MTNNFYLATTYLKLLRGNPQLIALLRESLGDRLDSLMASEYLYDDDIKHVFSVAFRSGIDSWLLHFGKQISVASHGPLGFAVLSAPDLQSALKTLIDYTSIRSSIYEGELRYEEHRIEIIYHELTGQEVVGQWLIESCLHVAQSLIETIMSHPLGDNAVINFSYPEPDYANKLSNFYGIKCVFNADKNSLSIPTSWGRITSPLSDPEAFTSNLLKCQELKHQLSHQDDVVETARLELSRFFTARSATHDFDERMPSLDDLAALHFCSSRTYSRKLALHKQSYKLILEQCRQQHASELLSSTHLTVADIAEVLAYQETANFVRAFKTWFDTTPAAWRRRPKN